MLNLKPVLQIQGEKLDAYSKARGKAQGRKTMIEAIRSDLAGRFAGIPLEKLHFGIAYTGNLEEAEDWRKEAEREFPDVEFMMNPLSLSVSCHIGPGALAITATAPLHE